jgi:DNA-binding transcriptional MerR regulator
MKNEEMLSWLKIIGEHLSTIGTELKHIRNLLELKVPALPQKGSGCHVDKEQSDVIPLDLEAFATQIKHQKE